MSEVDEIREEVARVLEWHRRRVEAFERARRRAGLRAGARELDRLDREAEMRLRPILDEVEMRAVRAREERMGGGRRRIFLTLLVGRKRVRGGVALVYADYAEVAGPRDYSLRLEGVRVKVVGPEEPEWMAEYE